MISIGRALATAILIALAGCAGVGIFATSDPAAKLRDARDLYSRQDRPLPAERLIQEAIEIYQANNDQLGLADAYRTYGIFLSSESVRAGRSSRFYMESGFLDKSVGYFSRYAKAIEYFEKAGAIFLEHKRFDALTNVNMNMAFTYDWMENKEAACRAFDRSLENDRDNLAQNPSATIVLPKAFKTYDEFVAHQKKRSGCT
jgi:tetratricopeptide (TPR) repeat protein